MYWAIWRKVECNRIIIHSHMPYAVFCSKFPLYCNIGVLEKDETVGMTKYQNMEDYKKYADVVLCGDVEDIGAMLFVKV